MEEVIRALIDLGGLVPGEDGGFRVTDAVAEITLPATLNGVITARIDRLPEGPKEVLRTAAVIGRRFSYELLAAVAPDPQSLATNLAHLQERELVRALDSESEPDYAFKHVLVQEAAYEGLLLRRRRELHGAVAATLEQLHSDRLEEFLGLLAYHYTKAEAWDRAQEYLLATGKQTGRIAADPETLSHFERALDAHLQAHGGTWGDLVSDEGIDWFLEWTNALAAAVRVRSVTSAIKAFHENVSAALGPEDPRVLAVAVALARAYGQGGALLEEEAILEAAIASWDGVGGRGNAELLRALVLLGNVRLYQDKFVGAEAAYLRALNMARQTGNLDAGWHLRLCGSLGWLYLEGGRYAEARKVLSEGLALPKQEAGMARGGVLFNLAWLHWALGDYAQAERYARACMPEATVPVAEAAARDLIGMIRRSQGDYAAARAHSVAAMETAEAFDPSDAVLVDIMSNVAEAQLQTGAHGEAERAAMRALALVRDMPGAGLCQTIPAYWTLAGVALARGQLAEAERLLAESETVGAGAAAGSNWVQPHWMQPEVLYRRAQLRRTQARVQEAEDLLEEACRLLDQRRGSPHPRAEAMRAEWTETASG